MALSLIAHYNNRNMKEFWKDIVGYEGLYKISNLGRIESLKRKGLSRDTILKIVVHHTGYMTAGLTKNGRQRSRSLSRLLYSHFKGELIDGMVIDHIDNNKLNNMLDNLQQITTRENATKDRWRQTSTSKYLGVSWCNVKKKWRATIYKSEKRKHIGYYTDEISASVAYQGEAQKLTTFYDKLNEIAATFE